jgi:hypothetical protein
MATSSRREGDAQLIWKAIEEAVPNTRFASGVDNFACCMCSDSKGILLRCNHEGCKKEMHLRCGMERELLSLEPGTCNLVATCPSHFKPITFCVCKTTYNESRAMISCDSCLDWFHYDCIQVTTDELDDDEFTCNDCKILKKVYKILKMNE